MTMIIIIIANNDYLQQWSMIMVNTRQFYNLFPVLIFLLSDESEDTSLFIQILLKEASSFPRIHLKWDILRWRTEIFFQRTPAKYWQRSKTHICWNFVPKRFTRHPVLIGKEISMKCDLRCAIGSVGSVGPTYCAVCSVCSVWVASWIFFFSVRIALTVMGPCSVWCTGYDAVQLSAIECSPHV